MVRRPGRRDSDLLQPTLFLVFDLIALEVAEFRKMDGGLTCLSLRF